MIPGTKMTNTGPFLWNGSSKIQFFTDFSTFSVGGCWGQLFWKPIVISLFLLNPTIIFSINFRTFGLNINALLTWVVTISNFIMMKTNPAMIWYQFNCCTVVTFWMVNMYLIKSFSCRPGWYIGTLFWGDTIYFSVKKENQILIRTKS